MMIKNQNSINIARMLREKIISSDTSHHFYNILLLQLLALEKSLEKYISEQQIQIVVLFSEN